MQTSKIRRVTDVKCARIAKLEEEARLVIAEAQEEAEARAAAKARTRAEEELLKAEAMARAEARTRIIAEEEARIEAAGCNQWFYMRDGERMGPVSLSEMRGIISDLSTEPFVKLVWTEGMDGWKPVYEVRKLCVPVPANERSSKQEPVSPETPKVAEHPAVDAIAAEQAAIAAALKADADIRAQDEKDRRINAAAMARAKAAEDAKLKAAVEAEEKLKASEVARASAEARAVNEARLRAAAEAKANEETRLRAAAEAKAREEAIIAEQARAHAKAEKEARARAENDAKREAAAEARAAEEARAAAEARATEEAKLRLAAESRALEEAKLRAVAEARAAAEARLAAETRAKTKADNEAKAKAELEAKAKVAAEARLKVAEEARANAEAKAAEEAKLRMAAEAKAAGETKRRAAAEAKAAEEAKLAAAAKVLAKAEEEARARAESVARLKAEKKARLAAQEKAARDARLEAKKEKEREKITRALIARANAETAHAKAETVQAEAANKRKTSKRSSQCVWFYTNEGDRLGPVSFEALRTMAADSSLDPRLDMVWRKSMDAWKPAGQIDGLFERISAPIAAKPPPSSRKIPARPTKSCRELMAGSTSWPGARRRSLLLITLVFPFAWHHALNASSPFLVERFGQTLMGKILPAAALLPLAILIYFGLKRLVNLGMSRLWFLAVFAPVLNLWVGYRCLACPPGYAYHKKLDGPGIALAAIYWFIILTLLLLLTAHVALLSGAIQSPGLQAQIRGLLSSP